MERGTWPLPESKLHINYLKLKVVFLALKEFPDLCSETRLFSWQLTTLCAYINKEEGMMSGSLCGQLWRILTWCSRKQAKLKSDTSQAECSSRQAINVRLDHPNREVSPSRGFPGDMQQVGSTSGRPVCNEVQQQVASVFVASSRLPSLGSGCTQSTLGGSGSLSPPASSHSGQSGGKNMKLLIQEDHSDCSKRICL